MLWLLPLCCSLPSVLLTLPVAVAPAAVRFAAASQFVFSLAALPAASQLVLLLAASQAAPLHAIAATAVHQLVPLHATAAPAVKLQLPLLKTHQSQLLKFSMLSNAQCVDEMRDLSQFTG